jgi:hypothetical protein
MKSGKLIIPSARRLMTSLRGLPYDISGAVADLVDNSLDAGARSISVDLAADWRGAYVRIADDGLGMSERALDEAMRYGSSRDYDLDDLGHFGLGLKTASLSQCRRLTVATRTTLRGRIRIRRWDLDRVASQDAWILERPRLLDCRPQLTDPLRERPGTVVLWEDLDRILCGRREDGDAARRRLADVADDISAHLAMVFHRFLAGEAGPRVAIGVNGERLRPWDPFAREERMTQAIPPQDLAIELAGEAHTVRVRAYVLPAQHHFSSPEAHAAAGGPKRWNRQQGLYIYRRDRLIQSGGWNRLRTLDEHAKLARMAVDIPPAADFAFRTDVAKMHVSLPDDLRPQLRALIAGVVAQAQDTYRQRVRLVPEGGGVAASEEQPRHEHLVLGDHWAMISSILERELGDQPDLLDRVLIALINARGNGASAPSSREAIG